ncbi:S1C family serine protease [Companilactobacillus zhongbaensis]|uniref:S1C family serine protease n=1 Tax=Companilactobacillus zhongbaensis TaxID=2486009 RepID=UPI000F7B348E|nr:trypsin-like peptidase domain-containing protein [Companilactobacillus zhongbaensis]
MDENNNNQEQQNDRGTKKSHKSLWKTAVVAFVSAILGVGIAFAGFTHMGTSSVPDTNSSSGPGTTQVSDKKVDTSSTMSKAYNKVDNAVVSVVNLQKQKQSTSDGDLSSIFGDLFGDSGDSNSSENGTTGGTNGTDGSDSNSNSDANSGSSSSNGNNSQLEEYSEGSGVIYAKQNGKGYIVTNNHVVSGSDSLEIILKDGSKVTGKLVGSDATTDLAVIEIDGSKVPATATFGNSDNLTPGDTVIAIGSPLGSQYATSVTQGIISATNRTVETQDQNTGQTTGEATVLQTDAAINPGNSGGPLVDSAGQVIGINSMKLASNTDGTSVEGMGFAIPSNEVVKIINELVKNGKVTRPSLGIRVVDLNQVSDESQESLKLPSNITQGVLVYSAENDSVAKKAGLKKNDVIVKVDSKKISSVADLHNALYSHKVGDTISLQYYRSGDLKTVKIHLTQKTTE